MKAGKKDRLITIQEPNESQDAVGQAVPAWADLATDPDVWAAKMDQKGREFFSSHQIVAEQATVFRIYYRDDLTRKMRVVYNGLNWDIHAIVEFARRQGLDLYCTAEVV